MRASLTTAALLAALALPLAAQQQEHSHANEDPDHPAAAGGALPAGWSVRADRGDASGASITQNPGTGLHVVTGPAIILYRADKSGTGPFHTLATFTQTKPSKHPEGYGLFFGGKSLDGKDQLYTYFLIRQDGSYLIKRRQGENTSDVTKGWVPSPSVKKPDAQGTATNLLEVDHKKDPSKVRFLVNGQEVYATDAKAMQADGDVGLRINHNLDVRVEGFDVHR